MQLGGAQVLVADLARGLSAAGHDVTLAAADGSFVSGVATPLLGIDAASLRPARLGPLGAPRPDDAAQLAAFARVRAWLDAHAGKIDVVHAHAYDAAAFALLRGVPRPVVHTLHLLPNDLAVVDAARAADDAVLVAVSRSQARAWRAEGVDVDRVIHNGVDVSSIPVGRAHRSHLLYAGRISPEKGVDTALDVAERLGRGILLVGGVYDAPYHERAVAPRVRGAVDVVDGPVHGAVYMGPRRRHEVHALMATAAVTLMPVRWDEPFGLVAVESLAAGTPVVASRRGGLTEIIDEGVGALVAEEDVDAFASAVQRVAEIDPRSCRRRAEDFDISVMVGSYVSLYEERLSGTTGG